MLKGSLAALIASAILIGCRYGASSVDPGSKAMQNVKEYAPKAAEPRQAKFVFDTIELPVVWESKQEGGEVIYTFRAKDNTEFDQEREVYEVNDTLVALKQAGGETYSPPLPILKAPMDIGDTWQWSGTMSFGDVSHNATASIATTKDTIIAYPLKVTVSLQSESGGLTPATRSLTFWFGPGQGVVRREFGAASGRRPVE